MEDYFNKLFSSAIKTYFNDLGINGDTLVNSLVKPEDILSTHFADFQFNGLMRIFQTLKQKQTGITLKNISDELINIVKNLDTMKIISKMELSRNFINIMIDDNFLYGAFIVYGNTILQKGLKPINLFNNYNNFYKKETVGDEKQMIPKKNIIVDYSSPNVAKSLHIGHLRSTIIGESIVRLLKPNHNVIGINHIGDWGTQFGMIINYLKITHFEAIDWGTRFGMIINYLVTNQFYQQLNEYTYLIEDAILEELATADSNHLMEIYRNAKQLFGEKQKRTFVKASRKDRSISSDEKQNSAFADASRNQTYLLQNGDRFNTLVWKKICSISFDEYSKIYDILNVRNLIERGESFYQPFIPNVIELLNSKGLIKEEKGAKIIMLDSWEYPLIIVKNDGAYTYDTTDIAALYHRLVIEKVDHIIYVTDIGQKSHFNMCFEVVKIMGWQNTGELTHIGFGLVCDSDGNKLKTRSGTVLKMMDVIDEIIHKSEQTIQERAKSIAQNDKKNKSNSNNDTQSSTLSYYSNIDEEKIKVMSRKIGINTLKYFDLSHNYESNYNYDPNAMFRFNGNTGVYLMYCFARINRIIEKSTIKYNNTETLFNDLSIPSFSVLTKETRTLLLHIISMNNCVNEAIKHFDVHLLAKYLFSLCTLFNGFITQPNGKIIGSEHEKFGIAICIVTSKLIESIFGILSFEEVQHI
jgi:arginyl-tRNA synthetase